MCAVVQYANRRLSVPRSANPPSLVKVFHDLRKSACACQARLLTRLEGLAFEFLTTKVNPMSNHARKDIQHLNRKVAPAEPEALEARQQRANKENELASEATSRHITHEGLKYDLQKIRLQMDPDLVARLEEEKSDSDQDFFDAYLIAHAEKYGERFIVS